MESGNFIQIGTIYFTKTKPTLSGFVLVFVQSISLTNIFRLKIGFSP